MSITISKVRLEDAYEYTACGIACWQSAYKGIVPDSYLKNMQKEIEQRAERIKKNLIEMTDGTYYCAKFENKIIGQISLGKCCDDDKSEAGEVFGIYLLADFWDKGYGRQMMVYAINTLKNMDYQEIVVWVFEENHRARRFYERHGFLVDGANKIIERGKPLIIIRYVLDL